MYIFKRLITQIYILYGGKKEMVEYYLAGGLFMHPILILFIVGIAICVERFISLNRASVNTKKFLEQVTTALDKGGTDAALEVCQKTKGPVASIFHAGF